MERLGKYRLLKSVGAGAMGEVWLAEHETLRIHHALKLLPRALASSADFRARFAEEGRVLALLRHPGIVPVHDMGHEGDTFYIAMDFVSPDGRDSQSLGRRLRSSSARRLDGAEAAQVLAQVLAAVEHAHSRGVIHRDIKPDNILLDHGGAVRVSDFGLASVVGADFLRSGIAASLSGSMGARPTGFLPGGGPSGDVSQVGLAATMDGPGSSAAASLVGTYSYMPPEVRAGAEWSVAGDIYSLGVVAYEMVVGRLPEGRWKSPTALVPGLPGWWDALVERALETDACDRWESVADMRGAMEGTVRRVAVSAGASGGGPTAVISDPLAEEKRRVEGEERRLEAAKRVYADAQRLDEAVSLSAEEKAAAWEKVLPLLREADHRVGEAESRVAHWKRKSSLVPYTEDAGVGLGLEMVWVKGGAFVMGSPAGEVGRDADEGPQREVSLDGFWLGKHEVTQGQYEAVMGTNPSYFKGDGRLPVENVSWDDAMAFCRRLSERTGRTYTLPTEAQWEYACRAGSLGRFCFGDFDFCFGDSDSGLAAYAWYAANSDGKTHPVGTMRANAFGFHDMHGNVWEWCRDWFAEGFYGSPAARARNPENTTLAVRRVCRGGGWDCTSRGCRSAYRYGYAPGYSGDVLGFRVLAVRSGVE